MKAWSLRSRLFVLIILPLVMVASLAAAARYVLAERTSQRIYDNTLLTVALTISRDVVLSEGDVLTEQLLDALTRALGDPVYYRIEGPEGRFITGYSEAPPPPATLDIKTGIPAFYDAVSLGRPVRAVTLREFIHEPQFGGWVTVDVWQTVRQRNALSLELLLQAIVIMGTVIVTAGLLVWFGINLGLRPLLQLREAVMLRSPDDLGPIRRPVPKEVRSLVGAMNSLFARLSDAFVQRDAFIADAAHQLRNPIAAIQAEAEAAMTAPDDAERQKRVADLARTARRAGRLTQQLLSMERVRGRTLTAAVTRIDLAALVRGQVGRFAETALRRGLVVSFNIRGHAVPVLADATMLSEAIDNLLDNAARYGCPDGGTVDVEVAFGGSLATIRVRDTGPGIPPGLHDRVFDRFFRADDGTADGCGLGLAIVRQVALAHGGTTAVVDQAGGLVIELTIPVAR